MSSNPIALAVKMINQNSCHCYMYISFKQKNIQKKQGMMYSKQFLHLYTAVPKCY